MAKTSFEPLPNSLWAASAESAPAAAPLMGEHQADMVVIGGGFCGLSAALHLAQAGLDTALVEANEIGFGASGRNGGQVISCFKDEPETLIERYGPDLGERMSLLGAGAGDLVATLIERYAIACDYRQNGWILGVHGPSMMGPIESRARQWQARGRPVRLLDRQETEDLLGTRLYQAGYLDPKGGDLNPLSFARGLARAAIQHGARIHVRSPATALERQGGAWAVTTPNGRLLAKTVLIATGAYSGRLLPSLERSVLPVQSIQVATRPLPDELRQTILPFGHVVSDTRRLLLYFRQDQAGRLVFGGRGSLSGQAIAPAHVQAILQAMRQTFPQLGHAAADEAVEFTWAGQVDITANRQLRVHELGPGLVAVLGFCGRGVAIAPAVGKALAQALAEGSLGGLPLPVTPVRPVPLHGLRLPAMALMAQWYRLMDRLEARQDGAAA